MAITITTAIATSTSVDPEPRMILSEPAIPDPSARKSDRKFGLVRSAICGTALMSRPGGMSTVCWSTHPMTAAVALGLAVSIVELSLGGVFATIGAGFAVLLFIVIGSIPATIGGMYGPDEEIEDVSQPVT